MNENRVCGTMDEPLPEAEDVFDWLRLAERENEKLKAQYDLEQKNLEVKMVKCKEAEKRYMVEQIKLKEFQTKLHELMETTYKTRLEVEVESALLAKQELEIRSLSSRIEQNEERFKRIRSSICETISDN